MSEAGAIVRRAIRGALSLMLFAVFGVGALVVTPIMLVLRRPERTHWLLRASCRLLIGMFRILGLLRVEVRGGVTRTRGSVIVANHPSLIDAVILTALVPRTLSVSKLALRSNPFVFAVVRAATLPGDEALVERAGRYLEDGWNVLIFPEGTRSPAAGLHPFHRGAAQIALRAGAPVAPVRMAFTDRILAKHQPPWQVGDWLVECTLEAKEPIPTEKTSDGFRAAAIELTDRMRRALT